MAKSQKNPPQPPNQPKFRGPNRPGKPLTTDVSTIIPDYRKIPLTLGEARFIIEYLANGRDYSAAYKKAISAVAKDRAASSGGAKLLKKPEILRGIQIVMDGILKSRKEELEHRILEVLWNQAFFDPSKLMLPDGSPCFTSWNEVPLQLRQCVDSIDTRVYGKNADRTVTTVKFVDRKQALRELSTYIGMMKGVSSTVNLNVPPETEVLLKSVFSAAKEKVSIPGHISSLVQNGKSKGE